jgi:outer membrane protein OmpA-like peptidoglycan-associated protein
MHTRRSTLLFLPVFLMVCVFARTGSAQEGLGPFMPNEGGTITTAWANAYGPDAESWMTFAKVGQDAFDVNYSSSRGTRAVRRINIADRMNARTLILGYSSKFPLVIPNTTTLGTSAVVLDELRSAGRATAALAYDDQLNTMQGEFTLVDAKAKFSIDLDGKLVNVPAVIAQGSFQDRAKQASGTFTFLNNKNNPMLLEYSIKFTGEKVPRSERFVRVTPGAAEKASMEQALATVGSFRTYGIHFDFDKATIRSESGKLIREMALTMKNNPLWTLRITGHTDSIGNAGYNEKLSKARANSLKAALVKLGVQPSRLETAGAGAADPVASNKTLQGRALNRRVELLRTDR